MTKTLETAAVELPELPRVKLISLKETWTCPKCSYQNTALSHERGGDCEAVCGVCMQHVMLGVTRAGSREADWDEAIEVAVHVCVEMGKHANNPEWDDVTRQGWKTQHAGGVRVAQALHLAKAKSASTLATADDDDHYRYDCLDCDRELSYSAEGVPTYSCDTCQKMWPANNIAIFATPHTGLPANDTEDKQ